MFLADHLHRFIEFFIVIFLLKKAYEFLNWWVFPNSAFNEQVFYWITYICLLWCVTNNDNIALQFDDAWSIGITAATAGGLLMIFVLSICDFFKGDKK